MTGTSALRLVLDQEFRETPRLACVASDMSVYMSAKPGWGRPPMRRSSHSRSGRMPP
ncbi:hypothetical protein SBA6_590022 [Candidatus Sulfopaludibacter sp. SbA6]|nr:hypothetical protein SBA6_590022 [Candidatus Sulfopaludibacter sp. SbA6]